MAVTGDGVDVADAEHGDVVGDGDLEFTAGVQDGDAQDVVGGEQGGGAGEFEEPSADFPPDFADVVGAGLVVEDDFKAGLLDFGDECALAARAGGAQG